MTPRAVVVGAGLAGLTAALALRRRGFAVTVLEERGEAGGNLRSERVRDASGEWLLDLGPQTFGVAQPAMAALAADAGIADRVLRAAGSPDRRFLWRDGKLRAVPGKPQAFLVSSILPLAARLRVLREPWIPPRPADAPEETLAAFCDRRLGRAAREKLLTAVVGGIYAGDPEQLGAESAFPRMIALEREHGSLLRAAAKGKGPPARGHLCSFPDGMQELPRALAARLGTDLRTDVPVRRVVPGAVGRWSVETAGGERLPCEVAVVTSPAHRAADLLAETDENLRDELAAIHYAAVAVVHVGCRTSDLPRMPDAFGFLVPRNEGLRILGAVFSGALFPGRAPAGHTLFTVFVGGDLDPAGAALSDDALRDAVWGDLVRALGGPGSPARPAIFRATRWKRAIPQAFVGHRARLGRIAARLEAHAGLVLCGNWRGGIAMEDTVRETRDAIGRLPGETGPAD